jgi:hypothetical protein
MFMKHDHGQEQGYKHGQVDAAMGMDMDMDGDVNTDMDMDTDTDTFIPTIYSQISDWNTECRMSDFTDILFKVSNPSIITYRSMSNF